ncbi:hypothetical protein GC175_04940 [bacterium]|nr:hypothetical protein [bacterium]
MKASRWDVYAIDGTQDAYDDLLVGVVLQALCDAANGCKDARVFCREWGVAYMIPTIKAKQESRKWKRNKVAA